MGMFFDNMALISDTGGLISDLERSLVYIVRIYPPTKE